MSKTSSTVIEVLPTRCLESLAFNFHPTNRPDRTCCLICVHPADRLGRLIELTAKEMLIGRDAVCDLELVDDSVSRRHARLRPIGDGFEVVDLGSTNGTFVNDVRVKAHKLEPGDRIRLGNQIFKYLSADRFEADFLENAYRMMTTDGLTQAYNRRYLIDVAERELLRTRRTGRPLSLLMIDVDQFKSINDRFGHLAGDEVLIELSQRLKATLRGDEVLARFGGEEFCLLLPDTSLDDAVVAAERLRATVAASPCGTEHANVPVTVSVGVACAPAASEMSPLDLIALADKQMYIAKRAGRNQVAGEEPCPAS
jgi:diguanylate cyclase (GGDEF)-like protein